jgi:hypothetical protein
MYLVLLISVYYIMYLVLLISVYYIMYLVLLISVYYIMYLYGEGLDSSVGTATGYGLDGPGFKSRCGLDFTHPSRPAVGPTQPLIEWIPGIFRGLSVRGVAVTTRPHLARRLKKRRSYTSTFPLGCRGLF